MLNRARAHLSEWFAPLYKVGGISFYCPTPFCVWRAETLLDKEPETIEWIDRMDPGDTFFDVGANVGCYSLYAAKRGLRVVAFEPGAANFAVLMRNIELNQLEIQAFPIALSAWTGIRYLHMTDTSAGHALHALTVLASSTTGFLQPNLAFSLDTFIQQFGLLPPDHLKIDVDGSEHEVLAGAEKTLSVTQSLMVESAKDFALKGFRWRRGVSADSIHGQQEWNHFYERIETAATYS